MAGDGSDDHPDQRRHRTASTQTIANEPCQEFRSKGALLPGRDEAGTDSRVDVLTNLTKALSEEFAPRGVRVNAIAPGPVRTPFWTDPGGFADYVATNAGTTAQIALADIVPTQMGISTGRITEPEEVAELTVFIASARAANIHRRGIRYRRRPNQNDVTRLRCLWPWEVRPHVAIRLPASKRRLRQSDYPRTAAGDEVLRAANLCKKLLRQAVAFSEVLRAVISHAPVADDLELLKSGAAGDPLLPPQSGTPL